MDNNGKVMYFVMFHSESHYLISPRVGRESAHILYARLNTSTLVEHRYPEIITGMIRSVG